MISSSAGIGRWMARNWTKAALNPGVMSADVERRMTSNRLLARLLIGLFLAGNACAPAPPMAEPSPKPERFALEDCPVPDPEFCGIAVRVANAIAAGDTQTLVRLSRSDRFECEDIQADLFSACETNDVLQGHSVVGADLTSEVLPEAAYVDRLEEIFSNVVPTFSDDHGSGSPQVLGIGRCGGDTYDIAWTAGVGERDATAERILASFEFSRTSGPWLIELWVVDSLETFRRLWSTPPDSGEGIIESIGCDAASTPWPAVGGGS